MFLGFIYLYLFVDFYREGKEGKKICYIYTNSEILYIYTHTYICIKSGLLYITTSPSTMTTLGSRGVFCMEGLFHQGSSYNIIAAQFQKELSRSDQLVSSP